MYVVDINDNGRYMYDESTNYSGQYYYADISLIIKFVRQTVLKSFEKYTKNWYRGCGGCRWCCYKEGGPDLKKWCEITSKKLPESWRDLRDNYFPQYWENPEFIEIKIGKIIIQTEDNPLYLFGKYKLLWSFHDDLDLDQLDIIKVQL